MRVFLFLLISFSIQSQTILLKGKLIGEVSKEPVVYANISFLEKNKGISSDEEGSFSLEIDKELLQERVHISCLNYNDTIVLASDLQNKILKLKPKNIELEEVVLTKKVEREFVVDKYRRKDIKSGFGARQRNPWIVTKYFKPNKKHENTPYVKNVIVYFTSITGRRKSKFRIRLFKIDSITGNPSDDIIKENIIAHSRVRDGKVEIDVSKYNIEFPEEGFFVGLERLHIPFNFYEYSYTMEGKGRKKYVAKAVSPTFGAAYTKDTIRIFSKGKWRKYFYPKEFYKGNSIQPAISLTLSN
ncbi:hypothetical protein WH52_07625 [Tenacibaculum holothuriorum]|uniref:Carboxypeptidase-like regulatory domain-containing protein n=1 Tax=Tenacibaculum holothuriorum TaxID=1635173 RepID=A0A1Y2PBQ6_9FLAO|nr:carboxypeptidase-like regulatory domain-containing protein [Tenacibaculum holothuriorum]OSY87903.1 hypothetical protein WH52_07625 [Tenacibaculum holothuriorum]